MDSQGFGHVAEKNMIMIQDFVKGRAHVGPRDKSIKDVLHFFGFGFEFGRVQW